MKVYCSKCKYFRPFEFAIHQEQCRKVVITALTGYKSIEKEYADPSDYNNNNNCKNYKYSLIKHINNIILESV